MTPADEGTRSAIGHRTPADAAPTPSDGRATSAVGMTVFTVKSNILPLCRVEARKQSTPNNADNRPFQKKADNVVLSRPASPGITTQGTPGAGENS